MNTLTILLSGHMPDPTAFLALGAVFIIIILGAFLVPLIFFIITLQNALLAVSPHNRKMPPGNVWLLLIPIFHIVWLFIVVGNIADSYRSEFLERNITMAEQRPSYSIGLAAAILQACCVVPVVSILAGPGFLVCWIIYWVKVAALKNELLYSKGQQMR